MKSAVFEDVTGFLQFQNQSHCGKHDLKKNREMEIIWLFLEVIYSIGKGSSKRFASNIKRI